MHEVTDLRFLKAYTQSKEVRIIHDMRMRPRMDYMRMREAIE